MNQSLLEFLITYGIVALAPLLFAAGIGVPLPASLLVMAAGAFASAGELNLLALIPSAILATVLGNLFSYSLGRLGGEAAIARWGQHLRIGDGTVIRAGALFARYGRLAIVLSQFPLSPLGTMTNLIAGATRYPLHRFATYNTLGVILWVGVYVGVGYTVGAAWEVLNTLLSDVTQLLTLLVLIALLLILLIRTLRQRQQERNTTPLIAEEYETMATQQSRGAIADGMIADEADQTSA